MFAAEVHTFQSPPTQCMAVHHRSTGAVTFDWPLIEQAAADPTHYNHALACMLIAARNTPRPW